MYATLFVVIATAGFPLPKDKPMPKECTLLIGEWRVDELVDGNLRMVTKDLGFELRFTFDKNKGVMAVMGQTIPFDYAATSKDNRHLLDLTPQDGPEKGRVNAALFKIEGDTLTICAAKDSKGPRPDTIGKSPSTVLMVLTRIKK